MLAAEKGELSRVDRLKNETTSITLNCILSPVPSVEAFGLSSLSVEYLAELCVQVMTLTDRELLKYGCCLLLFTLKHPKVCPKLKAMHGTTPQVTTTCWKHEVLPSSISFCCVASAGAYRRFKFQTSVVIGWNG